MEDRPVGRQADGDVAELDDLIDGKGQREEGRPDERESETEGGHGEKEDVGKDEEDVMERDDTFPSEAGKESDTAKFLILREGLEVHHEEIGEGEESQRDGDGKKTMCAAGLENKCDGGKDVGEMDRK